MKKNLERQACRRKSRAKVKIRLPREFTVGIYLKMLFLPLLCCVSLLANAVEVRDSTGVKDNIIKGRVMDEKGQPMPGVTVLLDSTRLGVTTDTGGNFTLKLTREKGVLVFSFIGFKTVKARFEAGKLLTIRMKEEMSSLDEVTVIAYGTQRRREVVGAMSTVSGEDIKDVPSPSIANLLQGRVSGMNVTNMTGAPGGGGTSINVRGYNSFDIAGEQRFSNPLWVIDGVPMQSFTSPVTGTNTLAEIDPNDIESIQVLKDAASAAIYGSRAANGVMLVTTKSGRLNQRAKISVNFSHTWSFDPSLPELTGGNAERNLRLEALRNFQQAYFDASTNTYKYVSSCRESYNENMHYNYFWNKGDGAGIAAYQDSLNPFYNNSTNFFKYYFRTAKVLNANLQLSGGTSNVSYNVGLGYYDESGVLRNTGFDRVNLLANFFIKPLPKVESNVRFYLARTGRKRASRLTAYTGFTSGEELEQIPEELLTMSTILPGEGTPAFDEMIKRFNTIKEDNESYRVRTSLDLSHEIVKGLKLKSSVALDFTQQNQNLFLPSDLDEYGESYSSGQIERNLTLINENLLTYRHTFVEKHTLDFLLGLSVQEDERNSIGTWGKDSPSDLIHYISWFGNVYNVDENRALKDGTTGREVSTSVGVFGRLNYNYLERYFLSVTLRRDASSKFGENVRWGTFPSYAVAWTFSEEPFMDWSRGVLDHGKLRVSYGKSGKQFDQPYIAQGSFSPGDPYLGNPTIHPDLSRGLSNKYLTWEETGQYDFGLDLDFFDHRFGVVLDYYYRYTDKLLYPVMLPGNYSAFNRQWRNAYAISNEGIELEVKWNAIRNEKLNWNISFNIARNWNRLEKSENKRDFLTEDNTTNLNIIGKPLNGLYVLKTGGIYNDDKEVPRMFINGKDTPLASNGNTQHYRAGDRVVYDVNGDGVVNSDDRVYAGAPAPVAQGGIITTLEWKGFDLNVLFNFVISRHILNAARGASVGTIIGLTPDDSVTPVYVDLNNVSFWQKPGDKTDFPMNRLEGGLGSFNSYTTANVENVSYLKLKTFSIGYTLPERWKKKVGFGVRVFVSGENLFTITNYSGADPESVNIMTGVDNLGNYPLNRKLTLGITGTF